MHLLRWFLVHYFGTCRFGASAISTQKKISVNIKLFRDKWIQLRKWNQGCISKSKIRLLIISSEASKRWNWAWTYRIALILTCATAARLWRYLHENSGQLKNITRNFGASRPCKMRQLKTSTMTLWYVVRELEATRFQRYRPSSGSVSANDSIIPSLLRNMIDTVYPCLCIGLIFDRYQHCCHMSHKT